MAAIDPMNPERYVLFPYPTTGPVTSVDKLFEDPDFVRVSLDTKKDFEISWATNASAAQSLELIGEITDQADFTKGAIALKHTFRRPDVVVGGVNMLEGLAEDVMGEVQDGADRVLGYTLYSKAMDISYRRSWPRTYHDIQTNEFALRLGRKDSMARFIVDRTVSLTAMEGFKSVVDSTLDEFATYVPALRR